MCNVGRVCSGKSGDKVSSSQYCYFKNLRLGNKKPTLFQKCTKIVFTSRHANLSQFFFMMCM